MTYTVSTEGLRHSFGDHLVLEDVDLSIAAGSVYALLGANGAGKTTLVRILTTLLRPDGGRARVAGHDLLTEGKAIRRAVSVTGQYAAVDEVLTGRENLRMMSRLRKFSPGQARRRTEQLLAEFDLVDAADRRAGTYSGGMKRRLDLAISVIERPRLLILDEPTTGLDPRSREQVWRSIADLATEGVSILLTTQYLEEADRLADLVGVLDGGRIVAEGTPGQLKSRIDADAVRLHLADAETLARAQALFPAARADAEVLCLEVGTDGSASSLAEVLATCSRHGLQLGGVETVRPSLDDVFLALTARSAAA